jgi:hypothetical protein
MKRAVRVGVPVGVAAGVVMALWSMGAMWVTGSGFWTPLNLVAQTFYRSAPLNGTFSLPAVLIALAVHMTVASVFGIAIAALAQRLPGRRTAVIAGGILFVAVVWPVMQWGVWYRIDEEAAQGMTGWIFAIAHLVFGVAAAGLASMGIIEDDASPRGRHAAGRAPARPGPPPGSLFQPNQRR